jgi:hypothetical protein
MFFKLKFSCLSIWSGQMTFCVAFLSGKILPYLKSTPGKQKRIPPELLFARFPCLFCFADQIVFRFFKRLLLLSKRFQYAADFSGKKIDILHSKDWRFAFKWILLKLPIYIIVLVQTLIGYCLEPILRNCVRGILNKKQVVKILISLINFLPISKPNKNMQSMIKIFAK